MVPREISSADGNRVRNPSVTTNGEKSEEAIVNRWLQTSAKGGTYLLRTQKCFKQCGQGPNMKVGDKMYHHVTAELIDQLF